MSTTHIQSGNRVYEKPEVRKFGTFRELTLQGTAGIADGTGLGIPLGDCNVGGYNNELCPTAS